MIEVVCFSKVLKLIKFENSILFWYVRKLSASFSNINVHVVSLTSTGTSTQNINSQKHLNLWKKCYTIIHKKTLWELWVLRYKLKKKWYTKISN